MDFLTIVILSIFTALFVLLAIVLTQGPDGDL